jgi:hypothetical protein
MKNSNLIIRSFIAGTLLIFTAGCDLKLQEPFDFKPESVVPGTVKNLTVWEWLQSQTSTPGTLLDKDKFDYMIQAIRLTGMEAEYSSENPDRTFLLMTNSAFTEVVSSTSTGGIFLLLTGTSTGDLATFTPANLARLKNILRYHIVTSYVDQVPTLYAFGTDYSFQTLLDGPNGQIIFRRDERYFITINGPIPSTPAPPKRPALVYRHNYIFKYGIAHLMNSYVGIGAY